MKTPIAITLIIVGALLVIAPPLSDYLYQLNVLSVMQKSNMTNVTHVTLAGKMEEGYRWACWATGAGMVAVAIFASLGARKDSELADRRSAQTA